MYQEVVKEFYANKNRNLAVPMEAYMRNMFPYLGIKKPLRAKIQREFLKEAKKSKTIDWDIVFELYSKEEREFQYLSIDYLIATKAYLKKEDIEKIEQLIITKSWWDTVDAFDALIGDLCKMHKELIDTHIKKYMISDNIWLRRIAIDFQLAYKEETDTKLFAEIIKANLNTDEFFINKAIGWSLREYSKINPSWVSNFVKEHKKQMSNLSIREALKIVNKCK